VKWHADPPGWHQSARGAVEPSGAGFGDGGLGLRRAAERAEARLLADNRSFIEHVARPYLRDNREDIVAAGQMRLMYGTPTPRLAMAAGISRQMVPHVLMSIQHYLRTQTAPAVSIVPPTAGSLERSGLRWALKYGMICANS